MKDNFIEESLEIAKTLDDFVLYHDPYEYSDVGVDRFENLNRIQSDLEVGNTKHMKDFLQDIESDDPDYKEAQNILQQIDDFEATYYPDELVIKINNEFIEIHQCDEGFDYSIYNHQYKHLDGGVYDDNEVTIYEALREIMEDGSMIALARREDVDILDYDDFIETLEDIELANLELMKKIEAGIEQNYNMLDGLINNTPRQEDTKKKSVLSDLKETKPVEQSNDKGNINKIKDKKAR